MAVRSNYCVACGKRADKITRGRCHHCYYRASGYVHAGKTSWQYLESVGFALPLLKKGKEDGRRD
jgi:hypothetical protein